MLKYIAGDLVEAIDQGVVDFVIHGCNCFHTMGSGVAKALVARFPSVLEMDRQFTKYGNIWKLGAYSITFVDTAVGTRAAIANLYTQYGYGRNGPRGRLIAPEHSSGLSEYRVIHDSTLPHLDMTALQVGLQLIQSCTGCGKFRYGLPKIGCGLGGGDWDQVEPLIDRIFEGEEVTIFDYP